MTLRRARGDGSHAGAVRGVEETIEIRGMGLQGAREMSMRTWDAVSKVRL